MKLSTARITFCVGLLASAAIGVTGLAHAQDDTSNVDTFTAVLEQIENVKIATAQREVMLQSQNAQIESLQQQIEAVPATKESVRGIVTKMTAEIEKVIQSDLPFLKEERFNRLDSLRAKMDEKDASDADLFRRALTLYDAEVNYGYTISAYTGDHPLTPGRRLAACQEDTSSSVCNLSTDQQKQLDAGVKLDTFADTIKDGNYVHFGRMSYMYLDLDSREGFRWSKEANGWEPLASGDILNARRAVRIARGESAPGVVTAPIKVQAAQ